MSFIQSPEHWFSRVAHEVMVVAHAAETGIQKCEQWEVAHPTAVPDAITVTSGALALANPQWAPVLAELNAGMQALWGKAAAAILAGDQVAQSGMLSIPVDLGFIQSMKDVIAAIEALRPGTAIPPKLALPAPTPAAPTHTTPSAIPNFSLEVNTK